MNDYLELILSQITALKESANKVLDVDSNVLASLSECERAIKNELRPVPEGMTREQYDDFLAEQLPAVFAGQDENEVADNIADVVGVQIDEDGNVHEFGSVETAAEAANELVAQYEEEEGEVEVDNTFTITYARSDGKELTAENVHTIINHPISQSLKHLGNIQFLDVLEDEEHANMKKARFVILEDGAVNLKTLALGVTQYRGVHVFPGLGAVQAVGNANFVE